MNEEYIKGIIMKAFLSVLVISLAFSVCAQAQETKQLPPFIMDSLDIYINRSMHEWNLPGLAVCIIKDGKIAVMKGYGTKAAGEIDPVDENTLFMIGSNTKAFTGTSMALLEYEGKCSLNDKVQRWLPGFRMKDPWVSKEINLTDILCHRMGLETYQGDFMYWTSGLSSKEVIVKFGLLTPAYGFREKYGYTNAGFEIAGECIPQISGMPWEEFVRTRIFTPLEMTRTQALSDNFAKQSNTSKAYTMDGDSLVETPAGLIDNLKAAGSIGSSVNDLSHWVICQLDSGRYNGQQVFPWSVLARTRQPQVVVGTSRNPFGNPTHFALYGLGLRLTDYDGRLVIGHAGAVNGFLSSITFLPEEQLGIIVLTNSDRNSLYEALKWQIIDAYLGLPYHNYSNYYLALEKKSELADKEQIASWRDSAGMHPSPALPLNAYCGTYKHEAYGRLSITRKGNELNVTFEHHPRLTAILQPMGGNRFLCTYSDPEYGIKALNFETGKRKAKAITVYVNGGIDMMGYRFVRK